MNTRELERHIGPICLAVIVCALLGCGGANGEVVQVADKRADGESLSADDEAAAAFITSKLDEHWVKGADGWTTEFQQYNVLGEVMPGLQPNTLYKQYRTIAFTIAPEPLTEAMKLNGTDYRAAAKFNDSPARFYQLEANYEGPQGWGNWKDESLMFKGMAVERRNGKWLISDDDLFSGVKPDPASLPGGT